MKWCDEILFMQRKKDHLARIRMVGAQAIVASLCILSLFVGTAHAAQLTLTWSDASTNEDGFKVERATGTTGAYGQLATVAAGTTWYVDAAVSAGTTYCYRVRAYNGAGDSAYSNAACATPVSATLYTVTVRKAGTGSGTVASSPSALNCGSTCSASLASGSSLALSATATTGSAFTGWSGACTGTGSCALVIDAAKSVTATFAQQAYAQQAYALTVSKAGTGSGTVISSPSGISCGATCSTSFDGSTSVTLTAAATTGSTFTGWSGACVGTTTTCDVTLNAAKTVTATFTPTAATLHLLWQEAASGDVYLWTMNGTTHTGGTYLAQKAGSWKVVGTADLTGDGKPDLLWQDAASGDVYLWTMNGTTIDRKSVV